MLELTVIFFFYKKKWLYVYDYFVDIYSNYGQDQILINIEKYLLLQIRFLILYLKIRTHIIAIPINSDLYFEIKSIFYIL